MRAPLSWIREYVDVPEAPDELVERLPMLGLGVDGLEEIAGDAVLDLEIAANRPDLLSLIGIARELAAWGRRDVRLPDDVLDEVEPPASSVTSVEILDPVLCPRYIAHVITGVTVGPSPAHVIARLEAAGIRPINNVVDATNYVMLEWGQPLHAFDLDLLAGHRIVVRPALDGEPLVTLDGVPRTLDRDALAIADAERAVALAGIIGGSDTEIGPGTRRVLLEAASFQPASVRRTSRRLGLRTEASARFERGVDPEGTARAARRAARMIVEFAGGRVLRAGVDVYPAPSPRHAISLRLARIPRLLGADVPASDVTAILARLGLEVRREDGVVRAIPPIGRRDLEREEDLIEEVARHHGYERIPEALPVEVMQQGRRQQRAEAELAARDALIRAGMTEAITISLINWTLLNRLDLPHDDPWRSVVPITNPLTMDHTLLRPALLPAFLEAVRVNVSRRREALHMFEIGRVFTLEGTVPHERKSVALAARGPWMQGVWDQPPAAVETTLYHLKGVVETLVSELRAGVLRVEDAGPAYSGAAPRRPGPSWLHPGRAGRVTLDGHPLGFLGELHPDVAARYDLPGRTYIAELDLDAVLDRAVLQPRFSGVPRYQAVRRDVAVIAPADLPSGAVEEALRQAVGDLLERVELFDVYEGPPLEPGRRNLAYALSFRAADRPLTGEEVEALVSRIHEALPGRLPVTIRT
jgi:phenylalanyl-tRNA synthetase beta chain